VSARCSFILHVWNSRREENRYREIVQESNGDFDRFLNSMLYSSERELEPFASASRMAQAFERYLKKQPQFPAAFQKSPPIFCDFSEYVSKTHPLVCRESMFCPPGESRSYLVKCERVNGEYLGSSIVLSEGNVDARDIMGTVIICGGDVVCSRLSHSMVFAAGNVVIGRMPGHAALVIAGGEMTVRGDLENSIIVAPRKAEIARKWPPPSATLLIRDGKSKPVPELFTFHDLWADYGLEAMLEQGRVRITKVSKTSTFNRLVQEGDMIVARQKKRIASVGQFRRLLGLSLDTGQFDFEIERSGKTLHVQADLKKK